MIVELEEAKRELVGMRPDIEELSQALHIQALTAKVEELEQTTLAPDFWAIRRGRPAYCKPSSSPRTRLRSTRI